MVMTRYAAAVATAFVARAALAQCGTEGWEDPNPVALGFDADPKGVFYRVDSHLQPPDFPDSPPSIDQHAAQRFHLTAPVVVSSLEFMLVSPAPTTVELTLVRGSLGSGDVLFSATIIVDAFVGGIPQPRNYRVCIGDLLLGRGSYYFVMRNRSSTFVGWEGAVGAPRGALVGSVDTYYACQPWTGSGCNLEDGLAHTSSWFLPRPVDGPLDFRIRGRAVPGVGWPVDACDAEGADRETVWCSTGQRADGSTYALLVPRTGWSGEVLVSATSGLLRPPRGVQAWTGTRLRDQALRSGVAVAYYVAAPGGFEDHAERLDTVRDLFESEVGVSPGRVYLTGCSGGGLAALENLEQRPERYDGAAVFGAHLNGWLADPAWGHRRGTFQMASDARVLFNAICPSSDLPFPYHGRPPADCEARVETIASNCGFSASPTKARRIADIIGHGRFWAPDDARLAASIVSGLCSSMLHEQGHLVTTAWGSPYGNVGVFYGSADDDDAAALNAAVERHPADTWGVEIASGSYTPTALLQRPLVAFTNQLDGALPLALYDYLDRATRNGRGDLFMMEMSTTMGPMHCLFDPLEEWRTFARMVNWARTGSRATATAPILSVPGTIVVEAETSGGAPVEFTVSASDLVGGPSLPAYCTPGSGSTFPVGTTTVTCTATGAFAGQALATFEVVVQPPRFVLAGGLVTVAPTVILTPGTFEAVAIDPATAGAVPDGAALSATAWDIRTSAVVAGPIALSFVLPEEMSPDEFESVRVLHLVDGGLVDVTADLPARDYATRTVHAVTPSLSSFFLSRGTTRIAALFDGGPHRVGSTIPVKVQLLDAAGANLSSAGLPLTALRWVQLGTTASGEVPDAGNANPEGIFRFDATLGGTGGYVMNVSTRSLRVGWYALVLAAGVDTSFVYLVPFSVE